MKLKVFLTSICALLGASIIGIPMIKSDRELINNPSDKTKTSNEEIKESVSVDPTSIEINGSDTLNGTVGIRGNSYYSASVLPSDADQSVTWSLDNNYERKILIDKSLGNLLWGLDLPVGTYNFTIKATSIALRTVSATKDVTLNILAPTSIEINGSDTLNGTMGTVGSSSYTANVLPDNIDQSVTWSLENNTQGDKIEIRGGWLVWRRDLEAGTYNFTIKATSAVLSTISASKNVRLIISYANPVLDNITLTGDGVNTNNINLTYGEFATIQATCPILNEAIVDPNLPKTWSLNNAPSGVSIDQTNGLITVSNTVAQMTNYRFSIIYQVGGVRQTLSATLTISYASPVLGDIILTKVSGDATITGNTINQVYGNASTFNASCNITNNTNIDPNLTKTWSLNNAPSGVSINASSGLITFSNTTAKVSNHAFSVTYTVGTITKTQNYALNVDYATPIFSDITLQGTGVVDNTNINLFLNQAATINASCDVTNLNNIDPSLTKSWAIENQPTGLTINATTGEINIPSNLAIGNYNFSLTYQCGTYNKQITINLTISYEMPILNIITLSNANNVSIQDSDIGLDYHTSGNFQATCDVTNQNNIDPSLTLEWSLLNAPFGINITQEGLVTIARNVDVMNNCQFEIVCQVGDTLSTLSVNLTINQSKKSIFINPIFWSILIPLMVAILIIVIASFYNRKRNASQD